MSSRERRLIHGDCFDVLPTLPAHHYGLAIADPPYIIGGSSIGNPQAKSGSWADQMNASRWYASWFDLVASRLRIDGHLLVFGNWRSLPTYMAASAKCSSPLRSTGCMVWDKVLIGTGAHLRPRWELILWLSMPEAIIEDRSASDVITSRWHGTMATSGHPAEKPVALLRELIKIANPRKRPVLDPFAGRGSAGIAAAAELCDYTGIEESDLHAPRAALAIESTPTQDVLDLAVAEGID